MLSVLSTAIPAFGGTAKLGTKFVFGKDETKISGEDKYNGLEHQRWLQLPAQQTHICLWLRWLHSRWQALEDTHGRSLVGSLWIRHRYGLSPLVLIFRLVLKRNCREDALLAVLIRFFLVLLPQILIILSPSFREKLRPYSTSFKRTSHTPLN